jgi:hypothetical protein
MDWQKKIESIVSTIINSPHGKFLDDVSDWEALNSWIATEIADQSFPKEFFVWYLTQDRFLLSREMDLDGNVMEWHIADFDSPDINANYTLDQLFRFWYDEIDK